MDDELTDTDHVETALAHLYAAREELRIVALHCATRDRQRERMRRARLPQPAPPGLHDVDVLELSG